MKAIVIENDIAIFKSWISKHFVHLFIDIYINQL